MAKSETDRVLEAHAPLESSPAPAEQPTSPAGAGKPLLIDSSCSAHSENLGALMGALACAQAALTGAIKLSKNPHLRNRYADLLSVWSAWQEVGPAHGLGLVQMTESSSTCVRVISMLGHSSGQWVRSVLELPWEASKGITQAQAIGSALTYARRYALAALVGVCPEDDDGNAAGAPRGEREHNGREHTRPEPVPDRAAPSMNPDQRKKANSNLARRGVEKFGGDPLAESAFYYWLGKIGFPHDEAKGRASISQATDAQVLDATRRLPNATEADISRLRQTVEASAA